MAKKYADYTAVAASTTLTNNTSNSDQAEAIMGAADAQAIINTSNGTFATTSDQAWVTGTTQGTSGTAYIEEFIPATNVFSGSIFFRLPSGGLATGAGPFWCGAGGTRAFAISLLSTEQYRIFSSSGATLFTSTVSGGFAALTDFRIDFHGTVATSTTGRIVAAAYTAAGTSAIANSSYDSGAAVNLGTAGITRVRHGIRAAAGTADDNVRVAFGYDPAAAYLMGPKSADPPVIDIDQPASNIVDLRASTIGDDSTELTFNTPTLISGPTLSFSSLADGIWLFTQDDGDTASVYEFEVEQDDTQTSTGQATIDPVTFTALNVSAPLRPLNTPPASVWG